MPPKQPKVTLELYFLSTVSIVVLFFLVLVFFIQSPSNFDPSGTYDIKPGTSVSQAASYLYNQQVIRSPLIFKILVKLRSSTRGVISGRYHFDGRPNVFSVIYELTNVGYGESSIKVTIPEGLTNKEISKILSDKVENFGTEKFLKLTENDQGYLFPDTYFLMYNASAEDVYKKLKDNFDRKTLQIKQDAEKSGKNFPNLIKIASILEREANDKESRRVISGILQNRLRVGVPLQVDATFYYLLGKKSSELTAEDLKISSPYNLYTHKGLPPTPISNPGLDAILAADKPDITNYLYYLSDDAGNIHYASNFEEHILNKKKYLNK